MWSNVISPTTTPTEFTTPDFNTSEDHQNQPTTPPPTRYKHSSTLHTPPGGCLNNEHYVYVYGGRSGTFALKDFWELDLNTGKWREIKPPVTSTQDSNNWPPRLQEHTLVSANNRLYMFGGECHHNSDTNSHVWVWCKEHEALGWEKIRFKQSTNQFSNGGNNGLAKHKSTSSVPVMRRGHSAVVGDVEGVGQCVVIYGGYRDLKGSLGDCWGYCVSTNTWTLLSSYNSSSSSSSSSSGSGSGSSFWTNILNYWTGGGNSNTSTSYTNLIQSNGYYKHGEGSGGGGPQPCPRHNHSAVVYNNRMYVYGGMCDLVELSDFWVFELESRRWGQIKCLFGPGVLKGHGCCVVGGFMYFFGGEGKGGVRVDDVWKFDFVGETFEKLQFPGCHPCPRVFATATKLPRRRHTISSNNKRAPTECKESSTTNALLPNTTNNTTITTHVVKKSTSTVRFADTQTINMYSHGEGSTSTSTSPVVPLPSTPSCSDYSSMETINYVENPNYKGESIEMRLIGNNSADGCGGFRYNNVSSRRVKSSRGSVVHPEYVLVVGGLETHKSAVFSKRDLVVWRLRVDCYCSEGEGDGDEGEEERSSCGVRGYRGSFSRERSFEVEF